MFFYFKLSYLSYQFKISIKMSSKQDDSQEQINRVIQEQDMRFHQQQRQNHKKEKQLNQKVQQLQHMCKNLSDLNKRLLNKITDYEKQSQSQGNCHMNTSSSFIDEFSEMQNDFSEIESILHQYRQHLTDYQQKLSIDLKSKNKIILQLKEQLRQIVESNATLTQQNLQIQKLNQNLRAKNQELIEQVQNLYQQFDKLERDITNQKQSRMRQRYYSTNRAPYGSPLIKNGGRSSRMPLYKKMSRQRLKSEQCYHEQDARQQLELLVQRLVQQLEHEKNIKKKMNDDIRRMSDELKQAQKEIREKNHKIYILELNAIRNGRTITTSKSYDNLENARFCSNNHHASHRTLPKQRKSFLLSQIIDKVVQVSELGKLYIIKKLVSIFEKKVKQKDLITLDLDDLQVINYSQSNLNMMSISIIGNKKGINYENKSNSEQILAWNMTLLIEGLLKSKSNEEILPTWLKQKRQQLMNLVETLMENSKAVIDPISQIAKFVENILR